MIPWGENLWVSQHFPPPCPRLRPDVVSVEAVAYNGCGNLVPPKAGGNGKPGNLAENHRKSLGSNHRKMVI